MACGKTVTGVGCDTTEPARRQGVGVGGRVLQIGDWVDCAGSRGSSARDVDIQ